MSVIIEISILIISAFALIYFWLIKSLKFFEKHQIPYIKPTPFFGNLKEICVFETSPTMLFNKLYYNEIAENEPFVGIFIFNKPALLIRSPELIKQILVKDFNYFENRSAAANPHFDKLGAYTLFFMKNPPWRNIRANLTPFFSSGKLKNCFYLINEVANEADKYLCELSEKEININDICARYGTDVIASVAFGVNANSIKNPDAEFRKNGAKITKFNWSRAFEAAGIFFSPTLTKIFKFKLFPKESETFLRTAITFVMNQRKQSGQKRNDLIDILIELETSTKLNAAEITMEDDILVAQAAIFFLAGFETSSAAMAFALFELSRNQGIQKRLRQDIKNLLIRTKGQFTYESINELEYLSAIIQETTRLYPTVPFLDRECTPPDNENGYSLKPFGDFVIPRGMPVFIPLYPIHQDPKYFPNPKEFNPERFLGENKTKLTPYTLLGFGSGPRNCIGERFGLLQVKLGIVNILRNHYVCATAKTPKNLEFDKKSFNLQVSGGLHLGIVRDELHTINI